MSKDIAAIDYMFYVTTSDFVKRWEEGKKGELICRMEASLSSGGLPVIDVDTLEEHPTKVVWLKHTAVSFFNFDGGPRPDLAHEVSPGIDYDFIPNGFMPYNP